MAVFTGLLAFHALFASVSGSTGLPASDCNTVDGGYQCFPEVSHSWGQYSPFFSLEKEETSDSPDGDIPDGCRVTFAQVLSRHGARYPTESKSTKYAALVKDVQRNASSLTGKYAFLKTYNYSLGADDLTSFGEAQMVASGAKFYNRYAALARRLVPFVRASGSDRVIVSGEKFNAGFQEAKKRDSHADPGQKPPVINLVIPEGETFNNTLDHAICKKFEDSEYGDEVEAKFTALFTPDIRDRLEEDLPGVRLSDEDVVGLMDMCSFDTVAGDGSRLSPFCGLFTAHEWEQYDYMQSLSKYYGHGAGHPLGSAQGIGFANELIARLTRSPVRDHTSSNQTLNADPATFPLNSTLYADFSHDNSMISIYFALGLYNGTEPLSKTKSQTAAESGGYSAAWTVPFAARAYVEMMQCQGEKEPLVRVLMNDRVVPLHGCQTDDLGRCTRDDFVRGLSFAREGGNWDQCWV
ncbi:3-phytase A [Aspergillus campestris IBT 28561]|uniref:Phytase A n=1 Tax=Aspergillus campestris (strain IBT 28561) TaxID=1392248 RepID=A0A2I1CWP3_ASPC2|nr:3-phytase A [Aspergillus campestris IBT 28561]PKY02038.1 3-phytase A [Aspergillus campestris IBT 28561]